MNDAPEKRVDERGGFSLWLALPVVIFVGLAIVFGFALKSGDPSKLPSALIGKPAPSVTFAAMKGLRRDDEPVPGISPELLRDGRVTVVNFWASWCVPCIEEHPVLKELVKQTGVRLVGVNYKDPSPGGRRFLGRYGNPYAAVGVDTGRGSIEWGVTAMPETFVVDGSGRIRYKHIGPVYLKDLAGKLIPAIEAARRTSPGA